MSEVPSNLIPTRVTQLPVAPVADENSLMMIVYQGNNYQIRVGDLLSVAGVPTSRQVIAGTGLTGGGQLTGNVTLSVAVGGIGNTQLAATGVTAGTYGDATHIPVFTVDAKGRISAANSVPAQFAGYVPASRQVIAGTGLTGGGALNANVTLDANLSGSTPLPTDGLGAAGVATEISRADHQHPSVNLQNDAEVDGILGLSHGGTARSIVPDEGALVWCGADGLYVGPVGQRGQVLVSNGPDEYTWGSALVLADQPANLIYAGPATGAAAPTAFRALVNADLPASGVVANTYGSATKVPVLSVNAQGVVTSATEVAVSAATLANSVTFNASGAGGAAPQSFNGSGAITVSRNTLGAAASGANSDITSMSGITGSLGTPTYIQMDNGNAVTLAAGRMWYSPNTGAWNLGMGGGNITQQVGEELFVYGKASAAITEGQLVMKTGTVGASGTITFAPANGSITDDNVIVGVATENIPLNGFGRVTAFGVVHGIDTTGASSGETWANGDTLWYKAAAGGLMTNVKPSAPALKCEVGIVINAGSGGSGSLQVEVIHGSTLGGTDSNVQFGTLANGNLIQYNSTAGYWTNVTPASVTGVGSVANTVTFNSSGGAVPGTTFNGSAARTVDYSTVGAPSATGTGASGTWSINISGNAATATTATTATNLAGGAASQIPYQSGSGTTTFLANGTAGQVLTSNGASAPTWGGINGGTF